MNNQRLALVTGASGFVGSNLVDLLISKNYKVRVIARAESKLQWIKDLPIEVKNCDYHDIEGLKDAVKGCDYIFHVAGVIKSKTKDGYFKGNRDVTRNLLDAAKESISNLKRFVHVSSQAAVGPSYNGIPIDETASYRPVSVYGKSKMAAELEVLKEKDSMPITICRPPSVYGPRDPEILVFFQTISKGLHPLIGFEKKNISLIHISDLTRGLLLAAESQKAEGQIYFISSEEYYSWEKIGDLASRLLGKKTFKIRIPHFLVYVVAGFSQFFSHFKKEALKLSLEFANEMVQQNWTCSVKKAINELGYRQQIDLETGFKDTIDWYKKIGWLG
jgi:nucleoside-diphosphate-sugar epimerase